MNYDSFEIAMLIKEIYSSTMGKVSEGLKESGLTHQQITVIKLIALRYRLVSILSKIIKNIKII